MKRFSFADLALLAIAIEGFFVTAHFYWGWS